MVEDAVDLRERAVPLLASEFCFVGVVRQIKPRLLDVVVVEVELRNYYFVEVFELRAAREVGFLFFFFLGLLLGFGRFLLVGPTRRSTRAFLSGQIDRSMRGRGERASP